MPATLWPGWRSTGVPKRNPKYALRFIANIPELARKVRLGVQEQSEEVLAQRRLERVQDQITRKLPTGVTRRILCPYCGSWNEPHEMLCCDTLRKAVIAVVSGQRALRIAEAAERAANN